MAAIPFMPLYVADYLADAAHLSTAEHGAYLLLLMTYWQRGEALPDDDKKLARITGLSGRNWLRARPVLIEFFEVRDNKLVHRRVERELSRVRDKSLKNRKGGLARAEQLRANAEQTLSHTDADTDGSVAKATAADAPFDPVKLMFDSGVALITSAGKSQSQARSWLGKVKGEHGTEAVIAAIGAAKREGSPDPIPYMEAALRKQRAAADVLPIC